MVLPALRIWAGDSTHKAGDSALVSAPEESEDWARLVEIATPARKSKRINPAQLETIIITVCTGRFMPGNTLAELPRAARAAGRSRWKVTKSCAMMAGSGHDLPINKPKNRNLMVFIELLCK